MSARFQNLLPKKSLCVIVCISCVVVIFGAWQKITHQRLADFFLTTGLLTKH